jgi:DNA-binding beta-propeller fold protein YncE
MSELKPVLERLRDHFVPPESGLERLAARRHRKLRSQRVATIALTLALLGGTAAGLWSALRTQPPSPASEPVVALPGDALDIAVAEGSVWILTCDRRCGDDGRRSEGSVVRVDPATGRSVRSATVIRPHAFAIGEGAVWVVDFWGSNVTRIDAETLRPVSSVHLSLPYEVAPGDRTFVPSYIATGEGAVWVGTVRGAVAKIDPMTNEVADLIELAPDQPDDITAGEGGVWVGVIPGVKRIDARTGEVIASIDLRMQPVTLQVADGRVWVEGEEVEWRSGLSPGYVSLGRRVLVGLAPSTGAIETRIPLSSPSRVAVGTGVVWVADAQTGTLIAVDPADGQPTDQPLLEGGGILAADDTDVWVADGRRVRKISFAQPSPRPDREAEGTGVPEGSLLLQTDAEGILVSPERSEPTGLDVAHSISPDDSKVVGVNEVMEPTGITRGTELVEFDTDTGHRTVLVRAGPQEGLGPALWSPNGSRVAYSKAVYAMDPAKVHPRGQYEGVLCVVSFPSGPDTCYEGLGQVLSFDWSPDGTRLLVAGPGTLPLTAVDADSGEASALLPPGGSDSVRNALEDANLGRATQFVDPVWSPSGELIAALVSLEGGDALYVPIVFSIDGRFVAMGKPSTEFQPGFGWSPVRDVLAYTTGEAPYTTTGIHVLDAATGEDRLLQATMDQRTLIASMAWSPSGRWLAVGDVGSRVLIIDTRGTNPPIQIRAAGSSSGSVSDWGA